MDSKVIGIVAALGSAAAWALGSILFKQLGSEISSLAMTLVKGAMSVVLLTIAVAVTGADAVQFKPVMLLVLSGFIGISLGDTFFFEALKHLGAHALVILLMLGQVLTALLAILFLGELPSLNVWFGIGLIIFGVSLVLWPQLVGERQTSGRRGILLGLLAVFCMSSSLIIAKQGLAEISALQATWVRMLAGTVGMFCFGLWTRRLTDWIVPFQNPLLFGHFLGSVSVVTFGGFWLSLLALKHLDVAIANTLSSTEPVFVLPLAVLFLREQVSAIALLGTTITMAGIVLLCSA
jgi:drug/metabolite transporter (DMT)-like permease